MNTVRIVSFRPDHAAAWARLNQAWLAEGGFAVEAKDRKVIDDPQGAILDPGGRIFMAERADASGEPEAIGCCALMAMEDGGFEVAKMTVSPAARGLGLGRRLLEACEAAARAAGARACIWRPVARSSRRGLCTAGSASSTCHPGPAPMSGPTSGWRSGLREPARPIPSTGPAS